MGDLKEEVTKPLVKLVQGNAWRTFLMTDIAIEIAIPGSEQEITVAVNDNLGL
jgi:hypothetical protein